MPPTPKRSPARRNKSTTRATLSANHRVQAPPLPGDNSTWNPLTLAWWADLWRSPMAPEYDTSDIHGLYILAALVNEFWTAPTTKLAAEIRLQRQSFGLSPIDRRRLQWEIDRGDEATERVARRRAAAKPKTDEPAADPRSVLRAVK